MSSMYDRLQRQVEQHEERLDDHLRRITSVESETDRTRKRLHRMENDRSAVRMLARSTQELAAQTRDLAAQASSSLRLAEEVAESAAEKAIVKAFARRAASRWRMAGRLASYVVAAAAVGSFIAYIFTH